MGKKSSESKFKYYFLVNATLDWFNYDFKLFFDQDGARGRETRQLGKPEERA
jgi:hypothetical protein